MKPRQARHGGGTARGSWAVAPTMRHAGPLLRASRLARTSHGAGSFLLLWSILIEVPMATKPQHHRLGGRQTPPTQPGVYWYQSEEMDREVMITVRLVNGQLTAWWLLSEDKPVATMKGSWRGPILPFPGSSGR